MEGDPSDPQVKQEPGDPAAPPPKNPSKPRQSSNELQVYSVDQLASFRKRDLVADSEYLDGMCPNHHRCVLTFDLATIEKLSNAKPDLSVLKDYKRREEEFLRRAKDLDQITEQRDAQKQLYDNLRKQRLDEFMAGFNLISLKLKEMYQVRFRFVVTGTPSYCDMDR